MAFLKIERDCIQTILRDNRCCALDTRVTTIYNRHDSLHRTISHYSFTTCD
jgi:hypothetical protein